jgi:hypothetical protein
VDALDAESVSLTLSNASPLHLRRMVVQAGAFGEHTFTTVTDVTGERPVTQDVNNRHLEVTLAPGAVLKLKLDMRRYCNRPTYEQPV